MYPRRQTPRASRRKQCQSYDTACSFKIVLFVMSAAGQRVITALTFTKGLSCFTVNCTDRISFPGWVDGPDSEWWSWEGSGDLTYLNGSYWHQQVFQMDPSGWWRKPFNCHQVCSLAHPLPPLPRSTARLFAWHQVGTAHLALSNSTSPLNNNLQRAPGTRRDDQISLPFWRLLMFQYGQDASMFFYSID